MNGLSEDDSSDSSNEFLVDPGKINLNSSFFKQKKPKVKKNVIKSDTEDESSDDDTDVDQTNNIELFTQVLQNLGYSQKLENNDENVEKEESNTVSTVSQTEKKIELQKEVKGGAESNEINELLLQGESSVSLSCKKNFKDKAVKEEEDGEVATEEYIIPKEGVQITLPGTSLMLKKKKRGGQDLKALLRRRLRANEILIEKVGLLCWLAYGFYLNWQVNQPEVMATSLSLISTSRYPKNRVDLSYLEKFTKWFRSVFTFETVESNGNKHINKDALLKIIEEKKISDYRELVLLYIAALRALGLNCRLVISLSPPHRTFSDSPLFKTDKKDQSDKSKTKSSTAKGKTTSKSVKEEVSEMKTVIQNSPEAKRTANTEAKKRAAEILRSGSQNNGKKSKLDTTKDSKAAKNSNAKSTDKRKDSKVVEEKTVSNLRQLRSRKVNVNSENSKTQKSTDLSSKSDDTKSKYYIDEDSTESETEFQPKPKRVMKKKLNASEEVAQSSKSNKKNNRKLLSSDSEDDEINKIKKAQDIWAEVYLESEESWICANVMDEKIHCVNEVYVSIRR